MSVLENISIQGIRSFDPQYAQVLKFFKPVTLILGQNGTGKTTIIECLKYATTGDLPPGSKVGGSFVHDPKMAGETEVKANVKLEIKNLKGEPMTVFRALKATQKEKSKQISMQTLDSSIKTIGANGKTRSLSSKCCDLDQEMSNSLGVSKAVLENVIFCHQEESNWPLMEGKVVKERFDDLFASARYVKALDSIRKTKTEKEATIKIDKSQLKFLKVDQEENNRKSLEKINLEDALSLLNLDIDEVREKLNPIEASIQKQEGKFTQLCGIQNQMDKFVNEKSSAKTRIQELNQNIPEPLNHSVEELKHLINDADANLDSLKNSILKEESNIKLFTKEMLGYQKENQSLLLKKGGLNSKIETNNKIEKELDGRLHNFVDELHLAYDEHSPPLMIKNIETYIDSLQSNFDDKKKTFDGQLNSCLNDLELKRSDRTKLEHEIEINKNSLDIKKIDLANFADKLDEIGKNSTQLNSINEQITSLKSELVDIKSSFDSKAVREDMEAISACISLDEESLTEIDTELDQFKRDEMKFNEMTSLQQQHSTKSSSSKRIRSRHSDSLDILFDSKVPETSLKRLLDQKLGDLRKKNNESRSSQSDLQSKLAAYDVELKQIRNQITENQQLVQKFDDNLYKICGNFELENSLTEYRKNKTKLEDELLTVQSSVSLYAKFQEMLTKNKSDCPLCHREFCNESEVDDLIEEINDKCNSVPSKLESISKDLTSVNEKVESLIKLGSQSEKIKKLKESVISSLESRLESKKAEILQIQVALNDLKKEKDVIENQEKLGSSILGDIANMDKYNEEIAFIEKNLNSIEQQLSLSPDEFRQKYEEVKKKKESCQRSLLANKKELQSKRKFFDDSSNKENQLTTRINNLESRRIKIQEGQHELSSLVLQKDNLVVEIKSLESQINLSNNKMIPVTEELKILKEKYDTIAKKKRCLESQASSEIAGYRTRIDSIKKTLQDINKSKLENLKEQLETIEKQMLEVNRKIEQNHLFQFNCKSLIENANSEIGNHKLKQRELQDTLQIRHYSVKIGELDVKIQNLQEQLGGFDSSTMQVEMNMLENNRRLLKGKIDGLETRKTQTATQIDCIKKDLFEDRYKNANINYLDMVYKVKTTELAIADLEKYYKALDKAIMSYHQAKMTEINKILKQLWRNTYSGKDIDYLEICSDEDTGGVSTKRKTYNYRVVMVKEISGARLDMRGRCSAGQKVLASLLIRLALAEVFCLHCGVLALDEPTTNLDQENIENLAFALVEIIKTRSKQKNFQLIVITHDEDFVKLLSRSEFIDEFYKIYSNPKGYSEIEQSAIDYRV